MAMGCFYGIVKSERIYLLDGVTVLDILDLEPTELKILPTFLRQWKVFSDKNSTFDDKVKTPMMGINHRRALKFAEILKN